jgi:hypothetical protein
MAKLESNLINVVAIYDGFVMDKLDLWGVSFEHVGDYYEAYLPKDQANEMIKAGRVVIK